MGNDDVEAFANIALAGDLSGRGNTFDHGLAADYLRLVRDRDTPNARFFKKEGIKPAQAPQGFLFIITVRQVFSAVQIGW